MADFHRLVTPTYHGGLPISHDLINDGTPSDAPTSPQQADPGSPNTGSYFVCFSEDASSANANRPHQALAENTDFLDDVIHRDLAVPVIKTVVIGGGGSDNFPITGDIYVGPVATPNDSLSRNGLGAVQNSDGTPTVLESSGVYTSIVVSAIEDGGGSNVIGVPADGFWTDPTIFVSDTLPAGTYRFLCYERSNVKTQPDGLATRLLSGEQPLNDLWAFAYNRTMFAPGYSSWKDGTAIPVGTLEDTLRNWVVGHLVSTDGSDAINSQNHTGASAGYISISNDVSIYTQLTEIVDFVDYMLFARDNLWGGTQTITTTGKQALVVNCDTDLAVGVNTTTGTAIFGETTDVSGGVGGVVGHGVRWGARGLADGTGGVAIDGPIGVSGYGRNPEAGKLSIGADGYGAAGVERGVGVRGRADGDTARIGVLGMGEGFTTTPDVIGVGVVGLGDGANLTSWPFSEDVGVLGVGGSGGAHRYGVMGLGSSSTSGTVTAGGYFKGGDTTGASNKAGTGVRIFGGDGQGATSSDGGDASRFYGGASTDGGGSGDGGYAIKAYGGDAAGSGDGGDAIYAEGGKSDTDGGLGGEFHGGQPGVDGNGGVGIFAYGSDGTGTNRLGGGGIISVGGEGQGTQRGGRGLQGTGGDSTGAGDGGAGVYAEGGTSDSGAHGPGVFGRGGGPAGARGSGVHGTSRGTDTFINSNVGVYGEGGDFGPGVMGIGGGTGGLAGVVGKGNSADAPGGEFDGDESGHGVIGRGGSNTGAGEFGGHGVLGQGSAGGTSPGRDGVGVMGLGPGVSEPTLLGSNEGAGVYGKGSSTQPGVFGESTGAGGEGVRGRHSGSGAGGDFRSDEGYGIVVRRSLDGARAAIRITPVTGFPTSPQRGDICFNNSTGKHYGYDGADWQPFW
jgi:hypothetical protein